MLEEAFWIIMCDVAFGIVQWLLILRFIYGIFLPENSRIPGVQQINKFTDPIISVFEPSRTASSFTESQTSLCRFYFAIIRFYILPTFIGYEVYSLSDLSIRSYSVMIYQMFAG